MTGPSVSMGLSDRPHRGQWALEQAQGTGGWELSQTAFPELSPTASPNMALSNPARMGQRTKNGNLSAVPDAQVEKG